MKLEFDYLWKNSQSCFFLTKNGKNISKHLSGKYSQKHLDNPKQSAKDATKTNSKIVIQRTAEATGN